MYILQIYSIKLSLFSAMKRDLLKTFYVILLNKSYCCYNNESTLSVYLRKVHFIVLKIQMKMKIYCKCTTGFANSTKTCVPMYICTLYNFGENDMNTYKQ